MSILLYLVKASACMLAFYTVYRLFLNRLTFFGLNRWYLLATMVLSFVIPALHFNISRQTIADTDMMTNEHFSTGVANMGASVTASINQLKATNATWTLPEMLLYAYLLVAILLSVKLGTGIFKLMVLKHKQGIVYHQFTIIKQATTFENSSFFNIIFLKDSLSSTEEEVIIAHEKEHIKRFHSIDIVLLEMAKVLLWFNPAPYLYRKSMEQVHEYEVDAAVTGRYNPKDYAGMLLRLSGFNAPALVNNFSGSQLNKRVNMLFTKRSARLKKGLYIFVIPAIASLVWYQCVDQVYALNLMPSGKFTVLIDAGHGGKNMGAEVSGLSEKDLTLKFAKAVKIAGDANGLNIILTRTGDEALSPADRLNKKADLLISLHVNSVDHGAKGSKGIMALTTDKPDHTLSTYLAGACLTELHKLNGISVLPDIKTQRIVLLEKATMPAAILEIGYMTNPSDLRFITNQDNQAEIAAAIVNGIKQYQAKIK